jgi:tRNA(Ile)-lysidine synthase
VRLRAYRQISGTWNQAVALACSGGIDSTALVIIASEALRRGKVAPFVVFHVDHLSRPESSLDADVVRVLCDWLDVPFVALTVAESGSVPGRSTEDLWRERRYGELARAASALRLDAVVTAHTRDDQVETVLMRMFSGSPPGGMSRVARTDGSHGRLTLIRPLLDVTRRELEEVLEVANVTPIIDSTNTDTTYRRNAVRHKVVPVLRGVFPGFEEAVLRSAELAQTDAQYCDHQAVGVYTCSRKIIPSGISLERELVRGLHRAIASRVIRLAALDLIASNEHRELTFERIDAVLAASSGRTGALIELPYGIHARIERDAIVITSITKGEIVD